MSDFVAPSIEVLRLISSAQAWHYNVIPIARYKDSIELYISDENNIEDIREELEFILNLEVKFRVISDHQLKRHLEQYYIRKKEKKASRLSALDIQHQDFLKELILEARKLNSSDIHVELYKDNGRIRLRLDGKLVEILSLKKHDYPVLVNKLKILSNMDIAEKRLPQDGRIFFQHDQLKFDLRVSTLPALYGEKVVLRILGNDAGNIELKELGFNALELKKYTEAIKKPHGIVLISGPTGSGKTTTLYATLKTLNNQDTNVITIEDPIEYTLDGINQVQLNETVGLSFPRALRTFLRQDPDIIMVGEIRDVDTANMAIRASLTGHLVFSTIHTNSAWGTIDRLIDMGIPSYLVANTLSVSMAQRLVRKLCPECKQKVKWHSRAFDGLSDYHNPDYYYEKRGCPSCFYTGYRGRIAIYELIVLDGELSECIKMRSSEIYDLLKEKGIISLADNAWNLFVHGETTLEEIYPILLSKSY